MEDMPEPDKRDPEWWEDGKLVPLLVILISIGLVSWFHWWSGGLFRWFGW